MASPGVPGDIQLTNASFIQEGSAVATPVASPAATPAVPDVTGYILGDPAAPNTLQIYADYRCPHCRTFHRDVEPGLIEDFVRDGRMNIELLDFTVVGVTSFEAIATEPFESVQAAEAAACAAEQDAFLRYRERLYAGPDVLEEGDFSDDNLIGFADELGLAVDQFTASLEGDRYKQAVIVSVSLGMSRSVEGTPTMILNGGEPFFLPEGGYEELKTVIEDGLQ